MPMEPSYSKGNVAQKKLEGEMHNIMRKIIGSEKAIDIYRLKSWKRTEKLSKFKADVKKKSLRFFGYILKFTTGKFNHKILTHTQQLKTTSSIQQVKKIY